MAKKNTLAKGVGDTPAPKIIRNYDPMSMEKRIYDLEQNGSGGGSSSISYSTSEHEVGTWTDGTTKVYEKTTIFETGVSVTYGQWTDLGATDAKQLLEAHIYGDGEGGYGYEKGIFMDPVMIKSGHLYIRTSGANGTATGYTIRYTK